MKSLIVNKRMLVLLLFFFIAQNFRDYALVFPAVCFAIDVAKTKAISRQFFKCSKSLVILIIIGIVVGIFQNPFRNVVRDVYYYITPILFLWYGLHLGKNSSIIEANTIIIQASIACCLYHFLQFIINLPLLVSVDAIRAYCGAMSYTNVLGIIILMFSPKENLPQEILDRKSVVLIGLIVSEVLYFSRTDLLMLFVFMYFTYLHGKKGLLLKILKIAAVSLCVGFIAITVIPKEYMSYFYEKIERSFVEIGLKDQGITESGQKLYRTIEIDRVKYEFEEADYLNKIVGYGFGHNVDLGYVQKITNTTGTFFFKDVGYIHNGFYKSLSVGGIVGILLFIFFHSDIVLFVFFNRNRYGQDTKTMIYALVTVLFVSAYFVVGIISKGSNPTYLVYMGWLLAQNTERYNSPYSEISDLGSPVDQVGRSI